MFVIDNNDNYYYYYGDDDDDNNKCGSPESELLLLTRTGLTGQTPISTFTPTLFPSSINLEREPTLVVPTLPEDPRVLVGVLALI